MSYAHDLQSLFAAEIHRDEHEAAQIHEPMIGLVTDNKDPLKLGRVKVKFKYVSPDDTTWWAPIVMLGAGKNRGWFFIPEKDDEVLVMFEHGNFQRPIIIGAIWNGKDKPADKNPGGVPRRTIKSRAGSLIVFDDENGKIEISDGTGKGKITFDSGKNTITIEALIGDVCFQAPKDDIKIVAKTMEMKTTSGNVEIVSGKAMSWEGGAGMTLKGGPTVTWSGSQTDENSGKGQTVEAPTATPKDVADPYAK